MNERKAQNNQAIVTSNVDHGQVDDEWDVGNGNNSSIQKSNVRFQVNSSLDLPDTVVASSSLENSFATNRNKSGILKLPKPDAITPIKDRTSDEDENDSDAYTPVGETKD